MKNNNTFVLNNNNNNKNNNKNNNNNNNNTNNNNNNNNNLIVGGPKVTCGGVTLWRIVISKFSIWECFYLLVIFPSPDFPPYAMMSLHSMEAPTTGRNARHGSHILVAQVA